MEIDDYVRALRAHVVLVLFCVAVGLGLAQLSVSLSKPTYTSSEAILVTGSAPSSDLNRIAADRISSYLTIARSDLVAGRVAAAVHGIVPVGAQYSLTASNPTGTSIIEIKANAREAVVARRVTQEVVNQFIAVVRGIEVSANKGGDPVTRLVPIGAASQPRTSNGLSGKLVLILGGGLGLFLGVAGALLRHGLDRSLSSVEDAEAHLGVDVLGVVPRLRRSTTSGSFLVGNPLAREASEAFRTIVVRLLHRLDDGFHRILVTSSVPGEGTSTVARNLAAAMAGLGVQTVLLAIDPRHLPLPVETDGYSQTAGGSWRPTGIRGQLQVMAAPSDDVGHPVDKLAWMLEALGTLRRQVSPGVRVVIVDAGAVAESADAEIIAEHCTHAVLVVECLRTPRSVVRRTQAVVASVGLLVAGVVLTPRHRRWRQPAAPRSASTSRAPREAEVRVPRRAS